MFEKRWAAVSPQLFTSNGTANGKLTVLDSSVFKVKQQVNISATALPNLNLEVKSIPDDTTILVGPPTANIFTYSDISAYTVIGGANIWAIEQKRSSVPVEEINRAVYEEEPVVATRVTLIDKHGDKFDENNPLPVNASVEVVVPPITVDIDALTPPTKADPDNVMIVGSEDGTKTGLKRGFVMNLKEQILATHNRVAEFTYADFGTKDQRVTRIDYTSSTFPGVTVRRDFSYTLVGNKYRRDDESWNIV